MDDYDSYHFHTYARTLDCYTDDNVSELVDAFFQTMSNDDYAESCKDDMLKEIKKMKNLLEVVDYRHITVVGARVFHYCYCNHCNGGYSKKWYLVNVWRGRRPTIEND